MHGWEKSSSGARTRQRHRHGGSWKRASTCGKGVKGWTACPAGGRVRADGGIRVCAWVSRRKETGMKGAGGRSLDAVVVGGLGGSRSRTPPVLLSGAACLPRRRPSEGTTRIRPVARAAMEAIFAQRTPRRWISLVRPFGPSGTEKRWENVSRRYGTRCRWGMANSLGDKTYMDILAFILQFNDFPPGNQELVPETAKAIVFVQKP